MKFYLRKQQDVADCIEYLGGLEIDKSPMGAICEIKPIKSKRTTRQNALYWQWLGIIANETYGSQVEAQAIHDALMRELFGENEKLIGNLVVNYRISSTTLTTRQFQLLMQRAELLALDLNISLPSPEFNYES